VPLPIFAIQRAAFQLLVGFDAFGDDREIETLSQLMIVRTISKLSLLALIELTKTCRSSGY
jgi:hypothetical protein